MDNKPKSLTKAEIKEIAAIEDIQQMWGAADTTEMEETLNTMVYAVKFNYHSGSPGYVGDYFILQGDALGEGALELIRNKDRKIVLIDHRAL